MKEGVDILNDQAELPCRAISLRSPRKVHVEFLLPTEFPKSS